LYSVRTCDERVIEQKPLDFICTDAVVSSHDALFHRARDAFISIKHRSNFATLATTKTIK
jgi:hypothetical protein